MDPAADTVASLEHDDVDTRVVQRTRGREAGDACPDHDDGRARGFGGRRLGLAAGEEEETGRQGDTDAAQLADDSVPVARGER